MNENSYLNVNSGISKNISASNTIAAGLNEILIILISMIITHTIYHSMNSFIVHQNLYKST